MHHLKLKSSLVARIAFVLTMVVTTWSAARAENHALLVGVSSYPSLADGYQLVGPANDVKLVRQLLLGKGFAANRVQVLADGVEGLPTRQNILAALDKIYAEVKVGDLVYLHFAGHGSQQPSPKDKVPREPDGKDEIFLPRDIGKWNDSVAVVENSLVNSEMNQVITRLRSKGAFVWAVFDSCHSGNMTRGDQPEGVRFRKVESDSLGIPRAAMDSAERDAQQSRGQAPRKGTLGTVSSGDREMGGFVAFYAAQSIESAPEMRLPAGESHRQPHGLFSYVLAETLARYPGITYRQLGQQVLQRYASLGMNTPTPLWEGTALDAPVFGMETRGSARQWPLKAGKGEFSIAAGSLQQFSEGAIFAVVPAPASSDKDILGYMRSEKLTPLSSIVSPIAYGDKRALKPDELTEGQYVRLVDPNLRLSLRVAMPASPPLPLLNKGDPPSPKSDSSRELVARQLLEGLRAKSIEGLRVEWVSPGQEADLRLRLSEDRLWLLPPDGQWVKAGPAKSHSIDLSIPKEELGKKIVESFQAISKAVNLLRVGDFFGTKDSAGVAKGLEVKAYVIRKGGEARSPLDIGALPEFRDGDRVEIAFRNKGRAMVDVTALYLDSEYGIAAMYPAPGRLNRIEVGADDILRLDINASTTGIERLMILAVDALPQTAPSDFSYLAQPKLDRTRGKESSIDALFREAGFGTTTRGATSARVPMGEADIRVYGWKVVRN